MTYGYLRCHCGPDPAQHAGHACRRGAHRGRLRQRFSEHEPAFGVTASAGAAQGEAGRGAGAGPTAGLFVAAADSAGSGSVARRNTAASGRRRSRRCGASSTHGRGSGEARMKTAHLTATHWGNYLVRRGADGAVCVDPTPQDHEPSPIGRSLADSQDAQCRVARPAVRLRLLPTPSRQRYRDARPRALHRGVVGGSSRYRCGGVGRSARGGWQSGDLCRLLWLGERGALPSCPGTDPSLHADVRRVHRFDGFLFPGGRRGVDSSRAGDECLLRRHAVSEHAGDCRALPADRVLRRRGRAQHAGQSRRHRLSRRRSAISARWPKPASTSSTSAPSATTCSRASRRVGFPADPTAMSPSCSA